MTKIIMVMVKFAGNVVLLILYVVCWFSI